VAEAVTTDDGERLVDSLADDAGDERLDELRGRVDDALVDALADAGYDLADVREADAETLAATPIGRTNAREVAAAAEGETTAEDRAAPEARVESFAELADVAQVGEGRVAALRDAGYDSLDAITTASPSEIASRERIGDRTAARVWVEAHAATGYEEADALAAPVESFGDLTELTQMGEGRLDVLRDEGYESLDDVAAAAPMELAALSRMGPETAARVCVGARATSVRTEATDEERDEPGRGR
jgi:hypothetical protein